MQKKGAEKRCSKSAVAQPRRRRIIHQGTSTVELEHVIMQREGERARRLAGQVESQLREVRAKQGGARRVAMRIYRAADEGIRQAQAEVDCKRGCSMCCHYHVMVSATEALALAQRAKDMPPEQLDRVTLRLEDNVTRTATMTRSQHISTNVPCAFLESDECTIYEDRPLACRKHHSKQVEICQRTFADPGHDANHEQDLAWIFSAEAVIQANDAASKRAGFDATRYEMSAAVLAALKSTSASQRRWRDGKLAFPNVRDKSSV